MSKFINYSIGNPYINVTTTSSGSTISLTGITLLNSVLIPANTFGVNDVVTIEGLTSKSNSLGQFTTYLYWNTTDSLSGAIQLGIGIAQANSIRYYLTYRRLSIRNATNNSLIAPTATGGGQDNAIYTGAISSVSIDWTNNGYIILAASHTSASETLTGQWIRVANY